MRKIASLSLLVVLLITSACVPMPTAPLAPAAAPPEAAGWQTYTNPAGFSISYPAGWTVIDLPPTTSTQVVAVDGAEGRVEMEWGTGFGGACPSGYSTVKVAQGELSTCHTVEANGIRHWDQINKEQPATTGFSARAYTKDGQQASADAVLAILATLAFETPVSGSTSAGAAVDPLPSWNEGSAKASILKFVADVTDPESANYVAPDERIVVTDNDGTLWTEKPIPAQGAFVFTRIGEMAKDHPEWATTEPYATVLSGDPEAIAQLTPEQVEELLYTTHAGMTTDEFNAIAKRFLDTALHPRFNVLYTQTVYQPMLELLVLLRANGFQPFIVSGGGADLMRVFAPDVYGIPTDDVVGSSLQYKFEQTSAITGELVREPEIVTFDNDVMKPVNIQRHIGKRPIMAIGNSDGDLQMFQYTAGGDKPYLNLLIVHDDAEREYDYLSGTDAVMAAAAQSPWLFVSMKRDFATMFPPVSGR